MSAFGALPLSSKTLKFDAVAASSNKCLEGVPGVGFILVKNEVIEKNFINKKFISFKGIKQGIENTNYLLKTKNKKFW